MQIIPELHQVIVPLLDHLVITIAENWLMVNR
jgi:hypothetical protein